MALRGDLDEVGDTDAVIKQLSVLDRCEKARRESGSVKQGPEAIARTREVVAAHGGRGRNRRATKHDCEVRSEDVGQD